MSVNHGNGNENKELIMVTVTEKACLSRFKHSYCEWEDNFYE